MIHTLGIDEAAWKSLSQKLYSIKRAGAELSLKHGGDQGGAHDISNVSLDVNLEIVHLDVAQGESTLIMVSCEPELCKKHDLSGCLMAILIDGGLFTDGGGLVARSLRLLNVGRLDAAVISHFDADHSEGVMRLLDDHKFETREQSDLSEALVNLQDALVELAALNSSIDACSDMKKKKKLQRRLPAAQEVVQEAREDLAAEKSWWADFHEDHDPHAPHLARPDKPGWKVVRTSHVVTRPWSAGEDQRFYELLKLCKSSGIPHIGIKKGDEIKLKCSADQGAFTLTCVAVNGSLSNPGEKRSRDDVENNKSIAWLLTFGKFRYYTAGDLPLQIEDQLGPLFGPDRLTALKCGHHGAETSTSEEFLNDTKPHLAFISAGSNSGYRHPSVETLLRLRKSPGMQAVFLTNCYEVRPFLNVDYPERALVGLAAKVRAAARAMAAITVPAIPARAGADAAEIERNQGVNDFSLAWPVMTGQLNQLAQEAQDLASTRPGEAWTSVVENVGNSAADLDNWASTWSDVMQRLDAGIPTSQRGKSIKIDLRQGLPLYEGIKAPLKNISKLAGELAATLKAFESPPAMPPTITVTSSPEVLGNTFLRVKLRDCTADPLVCHVGWARNGWTTFACSTSSTSGEAQSIVGASSSAAEALSSAAAASPLAAAAFSPAAAASSPFAAASGSAAALRGGRSLTIKTGWPDVLSLDAMAFYPPLSPNEYGEFLQQRAERQRERIRSGYTSAAQAGRKRKHERESNRDAEGVNGREHDPSGDARKPPDRPDYSSSAAAAPAAAAAASGSSSMFGNAAHYGVSASSAPGFPISAAPPESAAPMEEDDEKEHDQTERKN